MSAYGDFLLELSNTKIVDRVQVRNYWGQERFVPRRMLQDIYLPWGFPTKIPMADDGVGLPLAFLQEPVPARFGGGVDFDDDEAVMVKRESDPTIIVDYERRAGELQRRAPKVKSLVVKDSEDEEEEEEEELLIRPHQYPWGIRVDEDWLNNWLSDKAPKSAEETTGKNGGKRKSGGDSGGSPAPKRKRGDQDDEPEPKPKKRAVLTTTPFPKIEGSKTKN
jgi:hypothetical protein